MKNILFLLALAAALIAACKKTHDEPAYQAPDSSYGLIYQKIFQPSCALSGCHAAESHVDLGHSHGLTLSGSTVYEDMINGEVKNAKAAAAGLKQIVPQDTSKSWVYQKITYARSAHKYGAPMPGGGLSLTGNQILFIREWVAAGAPKEGHVVDKSLLN